MPGQYSASDVDQSKGQFSAADVDPVPVQPDIGSRLLSAAVKPLGKPFDEMVRDKISALAGEHLPPDLAGPVAYAANALTAIPASMVEFGRRGTAPLAVAGLAAQANIPAISSGLKSVARGVGSVADSPVARWMMGYRLSKVADIIGKLGESVTATSKAVPEAKAIVTSPNIDMAGSGISNAPVSFGRPPIPNPASPADQEILGQMTPAEKEALQKEIDEWNQSGAGKGQEGSPISAAPSYVKLPPGWKIGDPVPAHYTASEGTPNEANFEALLKQSLQRKAGVQ